MLKKLTILLTLGALVLLGYLVLQGDDEKSEKEQAEDKNASQQETKDSLFKYEKEPAEIGAKYFEEVVVIEGQPMYYAHPLEIDTDSPPILIVYCHGQLQRIIQDLGDEYMLKIREYGNFFASKGYVFAASNLHDDNWGQEESMNDIDLLIDWFKNGEYQIKQEILLIGFSMGGRTAIHYAFRSPNTVSKVALLAPTQALKLTQENVDSVKHASIKIWHGTKDVNIPFYSSQKYSEDFRKYSKDVTLVPIEDAAHYDIETTLMKDILGFFQE